MIKTKQELLNHFSDINEMYNNPFMYQTLSNMIDELLEQVKKEAYINGYDYGVKDWFKSKTQPCKDAISREELRNLICQHNDKYGYSDRFHEFTERCSQLPSVTPSYNSIKTELDHVIHEIIIRIEQTRDKDKLCEYPYNRCIDIVKEVLGDD